MIYAYAIGETVFVIKNNTIYPGTISGIMAASDDFVFKVHLDPPGLGCEDVNSDDVFLSPNEALSALHTRQIKRIQEYYDAIQNINELISFVFEHDIHHNEEAMAAFRLRAEDLGFCVHAD